MGVLLLDRCVGTYPVGLGELCWHIIVGESIGAYAGIMKSC